MKFQLKPILLEIKDFYSKPITSKRFEDYISKIQGNTKGDLSLPIGGFNPMAKEHILNKIAELENLEAERIMEETIEEFNVKLEKSNSIQIMVVLNIADDLKGAWTNFYSTDFDSKFKLNAFVNRKFCVPFFWSSESYSREMIRSRTIEYLNRTVFRLNNPQPKTLEEHLEQEVYSASIENGFQQSYKESDFNKIEKYYLENKESEDYDIIFNFFYGDEGSGSLAYKKYGNMRHVGYEYVKQIKRKRKTTG